VWGHLDAVRAIEGVSDTDARRYQSMPVQIAGVQIAGSTIVLPNPREVPAI